MGFYKSLLIGTIVSLIIVLAIMGVILSISSKKQEFPLQTPICPDYYTIDSDNYCKINSTIYSNTSNDCKSKKFDYDNSPYLIGGTGPISGACKKKQWANTCGVSWDGITNNPEICYIT